MTRVFTNLTTKANNFWLGGGGANRQHVTTKNTAKLDRETEELKHDHIPLELGKLIQQGRQNKGLSQKDLATVKFLVL